MSVDRSYQASFNENNQEFIIAGKLTGTAISNAVDVSGGAGGAGGTGKSYWGGRGGSSGASGSFYLANLTTGAFTVNLPVAGSAATTPSSTAGTSGAAANVVRYAL